MKVSIIIFSSLLLIAPLIQAEDQSQSTTSKLALGGLAGAVTGSVAIPLAVHHADKVVFNTKNAFTQYNSQVSDKILKDYRVKSYGVVIVDAVTAEGVKQKKSFPYKNKDGLRQILRNLEIRRPTNGTIVTKAAGHRPIERMQLKSMVPKGASIGLIAGTIVAVTIHGLNSSTAGLLNNTADNEIELVADPDEIQTTWLISQ